LIEATMRNLIAAALALLLSPLAARAGGYAIPAEAAREIGLSQSTVAAQTGPEAIYQNSAALAGQKGFAISGSLEILYNTTDWTDNAASNPSFASLVPKANFPPEIAAAYGGVLPNGMNYGVGAGLLLPGGGSLYWPNNWQGDQRIQTVMQRVYLLQAGGGLQPNQYLKLGASFLYYFAQEKLEQHINFFDHTATGQLALSGSVPSFGLSAEIHVPVIPLTIGIDYRHKGDLTLSGHAHFIDVPQTFQTLLQDQAVTEQVTVPNETFVGAAYKVTPDIQVMGSWSLERWVVYRQDQYLGAKGFSITVPRNYKNAYVFRVGCEYTNVPFLPALTLRAGAQRSISPQPTDTISPTLTDGDSWGLSAGAGYEVTPGLRADLAFQFVTFDTVTATGLEAFAGSYQTKAYFVSAGFSWRSGL
jgi:long-chain fatty acid transport protein